MDLRQGRALGTGGRTALPYTGPDTSTQIVALRRLQNIADQQHGERSAVPIVPRRTGAPAPVRPADARRGAFKPLARTAASAQSRPGPAAATGYAAPPTDQEKYLYVKGDQKRWFILAQYLSFISIIISFIGFTLSSYVTFVFIIPLVVYAVEQTLSLYTSTRPRRIDLAAHQRFIGAWAPRRYASVDVFFPTAGEDLGLLENSMWHMTRLAWPGELRVFILDDSGRAAVRQLAEKYRFEYLARPGSAYKKAWATSNMPPSGPVARSSPFSMPTSFRATISCLSWFLTWTTRPSGSCKARSSSIPPGR